MITFRSAAHDKKTVDNINHALKTQESIRELIRELEEYQAGYFYENPGRHRNDEEIAKFKKLLGEPFVPSTFEEDRMEFIQKFNQRTKGGKSS